MRTTAGFLQINLCTKPTLRVTLQTKFQYFSPYFQSHNIEFIWSYIESILINAMYQFIPRIKIHSNQQPRWFTPEIRHHLKCLRTLRRKHKRHPTNHHSEAIYHSEAILQAKISKAKIDYE